MRHFLLGEVEKPIIIKYSPTLPSVNENVTFYATFLSETKRVSLCQILVVTIFFIKEETKWKLSSFRLQDMLKMIMAFTVFLYIIFELFPFFYVKLCTDHCKFLENHVYLCELLENHVYLWDY